MLNYNPNLHINDKHSNGGFEHVSVPLDRFFAHLSDCAERAKTSPTLEDVLFYAPGSRDLIERARRSCIGCGYYSSYGLPGLKAQISSYAGWCAPNPLLRSSAAWDVLRDAVLDAFPYEPCISCRCSDDGACDDDECWEYCEQEGWE